MQNPAMTAPQKITIVSLGCAGNKLADVFYESLLTQCGVTADGSAPAEMRRSLEAFCDLRDNGKVVPRRIAVAIGNNDAVAGLKTGKYAKLYDPACTVSKPRLEYSDYKYLTWPGGYYATDYMEEVYEILQERLSDNASPTAVWFFHSILGEAGSGGGSWLAERITKDFPECTRLSIAFAPVEKCGFQPTCWYNSMLGIHAMLANTSNMVLIDHGAMFARTWKPLRIIDPQFIDFNRLVVGALVSLVSPLIHGNESGERMTVAAFHDAIACKPVRPATGREDYDLLGKKLLSLACWPLKLPTADTPSKLGEALVSTRESIISHDNSGLWKQPFCVLHGNHPEESEFRAALPNHWMSTTAVDASMPSLRTAAMGFHSGIRGTLMYLYDQYEVLFRRKTYLNYYDPYRSAGWGEMRLTQAGNFVGNVISALSAAEACDSESTDSQETVE